MSRCLIVHAGERYSRAMATCPANAARPSTSPLAKFHPIFSIGIEESKLENTAWPRLPRLAILPSPALPNPVSCEP